MSGLLENKIVAGAAQDEHGENREGKFEFHEMELSKSVSERRDSGRRGGADQPLDLDEGFVILGVSADQLLARAEQRLLRLE